MKFQYSPILLAIYPLYVISYIKNQHHQTYSLTELYQMDDNMFLCAVIVPLYQGKWVFVRQKLQLYFEHIQSIGFE